MKLKKNMNILLRGMSLSGGAPKSVLEYLRILKRDGHRINVIMQEREQELKELYEREFDSFSAAPDIVSLFAKRSFGTLYAQLCREYSGLKSAKPDLVLVVGHAPAFFYGRFCEELQIPCVVIIPGGDLSANELNLKDGGWCHAICFSEENREVLRRCADDKKISVIPNRIALKMQFGGLAEHLATAQSSINILLTSRVASGKYDSITRFIDNVCRVADGKMKINLAVAGGGDRLDELRKYVSRLDCPNLNIELKGHLDDLVPEFERAHLVVGKGRSVLEPIMMNRPGCVIGDGGEIALCTVANFEQLYRYNFSGRGLECNDPADVLGEVLSSLASNTLDVEAVLHTSFCVRERYSSEYLPEKLHAALDKAEFNPVRAVHIPIALRVVKFAFLRLKQKLKTIKK
ncbi:MAG: glycosyltransferase [Clostridia bacterium]|nr:glycosyltransferase [Clostridia bacterium]